MLVLHEATFDAFLHTGSQTQVVKFFADWCPDCRRIQAAYAQFPDQFPALSFAEVNADGNPELARRFDVRGIPTLLVFRDGKLVDRLYSRDAKTVQQVRDFVAGQASVAVQVPHPHTQESGHHA